MNLPELRSETPPGILYHYTSQEGLVGIIRNRNLWASKIHYMNDAKEFSSALDLARNELRKRIKREKHESVRTRLKGFLRETDQIAEINICVCSFSQDGDSLSQWRAYTGQAAGFSIGFSTKKLEKIAGNQGFSLHKCEYDQAKQQALVNELIDAALLADYPTIPELTVREAFSGTFGGQLVRFSPLLKDKSFSDEREWRLISGPIIFANLDHRPGRSMITPFFHLSIENNNSLDCLNEIIIGPTPHPELSRASVQSLLFGSIGWRGIRVSMTTVPFRNW